jgi:hypothetical protein
VTCNSPYCNLSIYDDWTKKIEKIKLSLRFAVAYWKDIVEVASDEGRLNIL